jgi:hypothetical protein
MSNADAVDPALRPLLEFCKVYRVSRDYVYDEIRKGNLDAVKVNTRTHITRPSEKRWRANLPQLPRRQQSAS